MNDTDKIVAEEEGLFSLREGKLEVRGSLPPEALECLLLGGWQYLNVGGRGLNSLHDQPAQLSVEFDESSETLTLRQEAWRDFEVVRSCPGHVEWFKTLLKLMIEIYPVIVVAGGERMEAQMAAVRALSWHANRYMDGDETVAAFLHIDAARVEAVREGKEVFHLDSDTWTRLWTDLGRAGFTIDGPVFKSFRVFRVCYS